MIEAKYYVYEWFIVETEEVFYVGKGSGNRVASMKDRNEYFRNIRKKHNCDYRIVKYFDDEQEAYNFEREYGLEKKEIGQARACYVLGNINRYIDKNTILKMSKTHFKKKHIPWNTGMKMDESFKEKCRINNLGKKQSEYTKNKRSMSLMNHSVSESARKRISESRKKKVLLVNTETGEKTLFLSISELAKLFGVSQSAITPIIKNNRHYKNKYYISYANTEIIT